MFKLSPESIYFHIFMYINFLFRNPSKSDYVFCIQIGCRSSVYSPVSTVRKVGSYVYEDFMPTDGTDVKVRQVLAFMIIISPLLLLTFLPFA